MRRSMEQRYAIKLCMWLRKSAMEILVCIQKVFTIIPSPKKARMSRLKVKAMLIVFIADKGVVQQTISTWGTESNRDGCFLRGSAGMNEGKCQSSESRHCCQLETVSWQCTKPYEFRSQWNHNAFPVPYSPDNAAVGFCLFPRVKKTLMYTVIWS